jgi:hypothetical protein
MKTVMEVQLEAAQAQIDSLERRSKQDLTLITELISEIEFLLPIAAHKIIHDQLCRENVGMADVKQSLDAMTKLVRSDFEAIVDKIVSDRRIDLLKKLMENE